MKGRWRKGETMRREEGSAEKEGQARESDGERMRKRETETEGEISIYI